METSAILKKEQRTIPLPTINEMASVFAVKGKSLPLSLQLQFTIKRMFDITASFCGLVLLSPVMVLVAIAIKLDSPGEVIFKQERVGKDFRSFMMYKFRSMCQGAENGTGPVWAKENDSRITRLGNFLRKTRLDEIPQLFNILKGDMSLIGPRPERLHFIRQFESTIEDYTQRLCFKPGLTGWAQIRHKYDTTVEDVKTKLSYDLYYINNFSFVFDLKILLGTIPVVITGKGAH